ncbi:uncharacterized protein LOC116975603 isoform X2 [Amblyraja radiata]|uniref:uncharacterized protein LOC116975603 isoform X2 n=1 Tax=Amblyraja radiata TaxID=386614 RepID=UPI001402A206|nr:uncharacterized protein LOC116975603 isoform X2 [Amblyraja radiata]
MHEDKAKEFPDCSYDQLCQWLKSQRTRFGKLSSSLGKSGWASKPLTDREQWIVEKWGFVQNHMVQVQRKESGRKLTMGISSRANSSEGETDPPEGPPEEPSEGPSGYGTADKQQHAKRKPACTTAADCDAPVEQLQREMFADIMQQAKTTAETISDLSQPRTPHERIVYAYSALLREEMLQIPESQWHSYCLEGLVLARAHRHLLPSPMRPMSFMPHPQMGMMAPQHAPQAMMGSRPMAHPWMAGPPHVRAASSTPHHASPGMERLGATDFQARLEGPDPSVNFTLNLSDYLMEDCPVQMGREE